jgi:hypothetical protein
VTSARVRLRRRTFCARVPGSASTLANAGEFAVSKVMARERAK